jgi:hypothetical protein
MKQQKRTKLFQRLLLLMLVLILPQIVSAYDFMANGIAYNIVSSANKTLEVTSKTSSSAGSDGSSNYSGNVVINEKVYYSGADYTVIGIGEQAFKNSFISSLKLPETLTYIKKEAFTTCFSLSELSIPASVTEIGASCFWVCPDLKKVYSYAATPPTCTGSNVFTYMQYNNATLYVPNGSLSLYRNAYGWKDFPNFMEMAPMIDGHEYVDLQLPSGKLWATKNYGASSVSDYGTYVEWSSNDIVNSSWGSNWKTPSLNDIKELINNCSWIWGNVDGKPGYTVKGNNGNSIFLPAAGVKMGSVMKIGEWCYYWSSTPQSSDMVYILLSTASDVWYGSLNTMANLPIRPVADNPSPEILATGITLNKSELSLEVGNSETLVATVTPNNVTNGSVTWSSSNTAVVSVNSSGIVTANAAGSAVITASTTDGTNLSAVCNVTVNPAEITGDVNNDGEVNITDINSVIDAILGGHSDHISACDVNSDGEINIADINTIIDIILDRNSTTLVKTVQVGTSNIQQETEPITNWHMVSFQGHEMLIRKNELGDMKKGDRITALSYVCNGGYASGGSFNVRMKNVTFDQLTTIEDGENINTAISKIVVGYSEPVYCSVQLYPYQSGNTIEFNFTTPFIYDGNNIVIDIRNTQIGSRDGWVYFAGSMSTYPRVLGWWGANSENITSFDNSYGDCAIYCPKTGGHYPNVTISYESSE